MTAEDVIDVLNECIEYLDDYSDAEYVDGRPVGNRAMSLMGRVEEARDAMARQEARNKGDQ